MIPKKKPCKKAKWLSEEVLQIAEKREAKGKGEKKQYAHLFLNFPQFVVNQGTVHSILSDICLE